MSDVFFEACTFFRFQLSLWEPSSSLTWFESQLTFQINPVVHIVFEKTLSNFAARVKITRAAKKAIAPRAEFILRIKFQALQTRTHFQAGTSLISAVLVHSTVSRSKPPSFRILRSELFLNEGNWLHQVQVLQ